MQIYFNDTKLLQEGETQICVLCIKEMNVEGRSAFYLNDMTH